MKLKLITDKQGIIEFEPDQEMLKKAANLHSIVKSESKKKGVVSSKDYMGFIIPKNLIDQCKQDETLHKRIRKPKKGEIFQHMGLTI